MEGVIIAWLLGFLLLIALLALIVYQALLPYYSRDIKINMVKSALMCLADLEFDYINPYDSATQINSVMMPEFILQGVLCLLFLISGRWIMLLLCAPILYYNVRQYQQRRHLIDVTEIFNLLNRDKKRRLIKLVYHLVLLFLCMFWMIWCVLEEN